MAAQWYCLIGQQQYGPFSGEQIQQLVQQGKLHREHGLRTEADSHWTAAGDLPGLFPPLQAAPELPAAPGQSPPPAVAVKSKKKRAAPTVSLPPGPPAAAAADGVPTATPVTPPGTAVPVAAPTAIAPVAKAAPSPPPAALPVAGAPLARPVAPAATAAPAPPSSGPPAARPVAAARPIPVHPVPAAPAGGATRAVAAEGGAVSRGRGSRKKPQWLVGGLAAALLLLIVVAVFVLNRSPAPRSGESPGGLAASPSGDPELAAGAVAAADPESAEVADPVQPLAAAAKGSPAAKKETASALPPVSRWLDATRQKGGIRDVVRLGVGDAWLDSPDGRPTILHVEVEIANLSKDASLEFSGWRPDDQPQPEMRAAMEDDSRTFLAAAASRGATGSRAARRRIAPGQSHKEQLSFVLPDRGAKKYRLALPYAALGRTGGLGFELPSQMITDQPPGAPTPAAREAGRAAREPSQPDATEPRRARGEPETIGELREEIDRGGEGQDDGMQAPEEPASDEPPRQEAEPIPDIRKLIEQEEQQRNPEPEAPPGEPAAEPKPEAS